MNITIMFTTTRSGRFIPMQLTNAQCFVGTINVPGGAEKGEVKYTSVVIAMVNRNGQGSSFNRMVERRVTGVSSIVAVAPSTNTATSEAAKQTFVNKVKGLQVFSLPINDRDIILEVLAPLNVNDTGSTFVTSITSL